MLVTTFNNLDLYSVEMYKLHVIEDDTHLDAVLDVLQEHTFPGLQDAGWELEELNRVSYFEGDEQEFETDRGKTIKYDTIYFEVDFTVIKQRKTFIERKTYKIRSVSERYFHVDDNYEGYKADLLLAIKKAATVHSIDKIA